MKKRILSVVLALMLVCSLVPATAVAAGITSVSITGVDHPVDGQTLDTDYTIPSGAAYVKDPDRTTIVWYDQGTSGFTTVNSYGEPSGTKLASGAKAVAGHYYIAALYLSRNGSGNTFPNKSFTVNVSDDMSKRLMGKNGWSVTTGGQATYIGGVYLYYIADTLYGGFNPVCLELDQDFSGTLVEGGTPWTAANFTNYSFSQQPNDFDISVSWKKDGSAMASGEKFKAGSTYTMTLTLDSGKNTRHATFDTDEWYVFINDTYYSGPNITSDYSATATFTFPCNGGITSLDIEGINNPVAGEAPQTSGFTVGPYLSTIKSAKWYTNTEVPIEVTGVLSPNTKYQLQLTMDPPSGYVYDLTKANVSANLGTVSSVSVSSEGTLTVTILVDVGEVPRTILSSVELTVNAPKEDELPVFAATPEGIGYSVYADDGGSYIGGVSWQDVTEDASLTDKDRVLKNGGKFLPGHTYEVGVKLTALDGFEFSENATATVNGKTAEAYLQGEELRVYYKFPALDASIDKVSLTVTAPVAGEGPDCTVKVDGEGYTVQEYTGGGYIQGVLWYDDITTKPLAATDKFEDGRSYGVVIRLESAENAFAIDSNGSSAVTATINETEATVGTYGVDARNGITVSAHFIAGEEAPYDFDCHGLSSCPQFTIFEDAVPYDHWAHAAIDWALIKEVTNGVDKTHFGPNETVTRGQAVTFLWRAAGRPEPKSTNNPFKDVKESQYYYKPILWAVENGITIGTDKTHFSPNETCSSAHIITFLYRAMGVGNDGWYKEARSWAAGAKLLDDTGLKVEPGEDCPRMAVVTYLYRFYVK